MSGRSRVLVAALCVLAASLCATAAASAAVTPGWECIPSTPGAAVTSGGTGATPSCAAGTPVLAPTYVASGVGRKPTVEFAAVNVQIVNGAGKTGSTNGTGNLVLGYDEQPGSQGGSHDLVLGNQQSFSGYGDLVAGHHNKVGGNFAAAFGSQNAAAGDSSLAAGARNTAKGTATSVLGGEFNQAIDDFSAVLGGCDNLTGSATAPTSACAGTGLEAIGGGKQDRASGVESEVSGGYANTASGPISAVVGGARNAANGNLSSVGGGADNTASGIESSVAGGGFNAASEALSTVSGGEHNNSTGRSTSVLGGEFNTAFDDWGAVVGGCSNFAGSTSATPDDQCTDTTDYPGDFDVVAGGVGNQAQALGSAALGGHNRAVGTDLNSQIGPTGFAP